ncbi:MAG TPA: SDR family oxidoreductase [Acidimicrobiales bacterium]|nr:SDR family oxidoreductase [Acidimicrobiales bacterium]
MAELVLAGQGALVTGGGSGIGLACARHLLRDGASVVIAGRSRARLDAAVAELEAEAPDGAQVGAVECDVSDEDAVAAAVAATVELAGNLTLCVASAGTGTVGPVLRLPADQWRQVLDINLTGAFFTLKHAADAMVRAGGGAFVGLSSIAAPLTHPHMSAYCVSKAGLEALVRTAADELGRAGVRCNAVRPSLVPTELASPLEQDPAVLADYLAQMPVSRTGTVDDVASLVRFLCGPESSWITGECIGVDGGHHLRRGPNVEHWARMLYGDDVVDGDLGAADGG